MTPLRLRDGLTGHAWFRAWLACVVTVLTVAVALHHGGPMGGMDHGAGNRGPTQHAPPGATPGHAQHAGHASASTATMVAAPHEHDASHEHPQGTGAAMAMCLAILASALLLPTAVWLRRAAARVRAFRGARRSHRVARPPFVVVPATWHPPPRGGPPLFASLCVIRR